MGKQVIDLLPSDLLCEQSTVDYRLNLLISTLDCGLNQTAMQKKIQSFFLNLKNKKAAAEKSVLRKNVPYTEARQVGILFASEREEDYTVINKFVQRLAKDGKKIMALTYFERLQSNGYDFQFDYFTKEQISATGVLTSEKVDRFIEANFDYLFCISKHSFLPFDYILLRSRAKCRIGMYIEEKPDCFELMIKPKPEDTLESLMNQLLLYIKALIPDGK
jgi:hypothetical protein